MMVCAVSVHGGMEGMEGCIVWLLGSECTCSASLVAVKLAYLGALKMILSRINVGCGSLVDWFDGFKCSRLQYTHAYTSFPICNTVGEGGFGERLSNQFKAPR
jgi:hypothetical protein